jgi:hypothetical protein
MWTELYIQNSDRSASDIASHPVSVVASPTTMRGDALFRRALQDQILCRSRLHVVKALVEAIWPVRWNVWNGWEANVSLRELNDCSRSSGNIAGPKTVSVFRRLLLKADQLPTANII